ncbi:MAG: 16S rRNA processing protein RimM [Spirochaetes bacterium]|nr:MAG: 16S rRNA processing protein RimM [Spirochaetota bacterium]
MEKLAVAVIRTSHGVKGFVKVRSLSGECEHLFKLDEVILKKRGKEIPKRVEEIKPLGNELLIKFEGINTPEEGKKYATWEIWVSRDKANPLAEGEYYVADLCECRVLRGEEQIGRVVSVCDTYQSHLEVITKDGKKTLIPFQKEFIGEIDLDKKTIELKVDWIL